MRVGAVFGIALGIGLVFTGCKLSTDYFSDYNGVNLISQHEFGADWSSRTKGLDNTSGLDLYMNWADAGVTGPGGGEAYKLEIKNLIPDGDFTGGTPPYAPNSSYWTPTSGDTLSVVASSTGFSGVPNLHYVSGGNTNVLTLDLLAAIDSTTGFTAASHNYQFQMDFVDEAGTAFNIYHKFNAGTPTPVAELTAQTLITQSTSYQSTPLSLSAMPGAATSLAMTYTSSIPTQSIVTFTNGTQAETFSLHNVRLVPDDVDLYATLSLPSLFSTTKQLIQGSYTFSVYVKDDPSVGSANHMTANGLTLRVTIATESGATAQIIKTAARDSTWSGWTKLTFNLGTLQFADSDSLLNGAKAITIDLSPTLMNTGTRDAGTLYVSDPTLTFVH